MGVLVTLYEYSPLFSIALVSLCFVVTAAVVLGRFGFDVPVILQSSDDSESIPPTPEKPMVQVTNPFSLELGRGLASVTDGVAVRSCCLEPCVLSCFWGCEVGALQGALQAHQHQGRLSGHQHFLEALHLRYQHCQRFQIRSQDTEEHRTLIPSHLDVTHFGPLPRQRYPLVAVLTTAEAESTHDIVASVTVVHVPDHFYKLSARILFQYLLTSQGSVYELKPLFMSADPDGIPPEPEPSSDPREPPREEEEEEEEDWSGDSARDCVICQNGAVNRVLLPCRHACVCDQCVTHFQHCPICRAFVMESFMLGPPPP